ncbi:GNAT family N-acetyltransferase [Sulfurospirillum diekertiae]|uniref:L-methionine sulfoximine/L-methionine sulfone acetyltransferase n=1 Tax=Sulfurospirillum diekertiae TaxID=1854492 RepID=A0A1Y0HKI6_9BACT|nr:GNAT family N-acetyltransferase [Sulfurospirillum diekertiae]ARU48470.1 L-methionine sulfoximine/L-methionine sulfone acetyltransferase [Sulfurospirillum diekertiae]ASC93304.1 L-methionine sulfoximine/L-methionine sulfone acetyltransferase [Sulfurospirillum diekertiae]
MIRFADENDLEAILAIYNDAILNTTAVYTYHAKTLEERQHWFHKKEEEGYPLWVYEHDGKVVGYATYGSFRSSPAYKYTIEHSVYVQKDFRKQGIGKILLETIIADANTKGYATIVAGIDASNAKSIQLHKKLGFSAAGIVHKAGYKFGQWLDLAFYELLLDGPKNPTEG